MTKPRSRFVLPGMPTVSGEAKLDPADIAKAREAFLVRFPFAKAALARSPATTYGWSNEYMGVPRENDERDETREDAPEPLTPEQAFRARMRALRGQR